MALFKICRGNEENLPTTLTDGYAYFCADTGSFYIDYTDSEGNLARRMIKAEYANSAGTASIADKAKAVYDASNGGLGAKGFSAYGYEMSQMVKRGRYEDLLDRPFGEVPTIYETDENGNIDDIYPLDFTGISQIFPVFGFGEDAAPLCISASIDNVPSPVRGANYIFTLDGARHPCAATYLPDVSRTLEDGSVQSANYNDSDANSVAYFWGNWGLTGFPSLNSDTDYFGENTGESYLITWSQGNLTIYIANELKEAYLGQHPVSSLVPAEEYFTIDEKYLPECVVTETSLANKGFATQSYVDAAVANAGGGSGGGASVQADWAQNDDTQTDYVKNRPGGYVVSYPELDYTFDGELDGKEYSSVTEGSSTYAFARCGDPVEDVQRFIGATIRMRVYDEPIIQESTVTGFAYNSFWGAYAQNGKSDVSFEGAVMITGETGHVTWDGDTYECPIQDASDVLGAGWWALGNCTEFGLSGNDEPFIIAIADGEPPIYVALTDTEEGWEHTVSVAGAIAIGCDINSEDYIIDLGSESEIEGATPGAIYMIGELFAVNILAQTDVGQLWTALTNTEQPSQIVSPGLYLLKYIYGTQLIYVSELLIPATTTAVEIPEKYTEAKSNKLGGRWFYGATMTWDGNTEGLEQLGQLDLYRISEDVIPATLPVTLTDTTESGASDLTFDSLNYLGDKNNPIAFFGIVGDGYPLLYVVYADQTVDDISVKKGIYAFAGEIEGCACYISKITVASGWARWPSAMLESRVVAKNYTLYSSNWAGTSAPYSYSLTASGLTAEDDGMIGLGKSATVTQAEAARNAMIRVTDQTSNVLTLAADGTKPTVNIPVTVMIL